MDPEDTTLEYWKILDIMFSLRTRRPSMVSRLSLRVHGSSLDLRLPAALEGIRVVEEPEGPHPALAPSVPRPQLNPWDSIPLRDGGIPFGPEGPVLLFDCDFRKRGCTGGVGGRF